MKKAFVIAATASGVGKTTVTVGVMEALRRRGLVVQSFKAGPDYIDPGYHAALTGRTCYNLDTWMDSKGVVGTFGRAMVGADVGVVEGVMGLFDGRGVTSEGSTAALAKKLGLPVVLVVDASGASTSVAATVKGFNEFDKKIKLAGVMLNKVGSERHLLLLIDAVEKKAGVKVIGSLPRDVSLAVPSRHLGLYTRGDLTEGEWGGFLRSVGNAASHSIDTDLLLKLAGEVKADDSKGAAAKKFKGETVTVAVARDEAFCFCYPENLELLERFGARIVFFSPLRDRRLPAGTRGVYLVGGYPELHGPALECNEKMRAEMSAFSRSGGAVFAECGGLMYLGRAIRDAGGRRYEMAGVFPWTARVYPKRRSLGYREVVARSGCPFLARGERVRGHEYHYSALSPSAGNVKQGFVGGVGVGGEGGDGVGYVYKNTLATYVHLLFSSNPAFVEGFIKACRR